MSTVDNEWPLFEVFIRAARASSTSTPAASTRPMRKWRSITRVTCYTRRQEGVSIWVVPSAQIVASDPADADALFEPARDKIYRHPTFYAIPDEVKNL
jgi:ring-1,2-phenylacetyl-CoA epoxidase subunit PaaB